jgi:uncharacterized membrane protein
MEFWVFILAVLLAAEWIKRRAYQKQNDERFARLIGNLNKLDTELRELRKLPARIAELENRPPAAAQESPAVAGPSVAAPAPHSDVKHEIQIPASLQVPPPVVVKPSEPLKPPTVVVTSADAISKLVTPAAAAPPVAPPHAATPPPPRPPVSPSASAASRPIFSTPVSAARPAGIHSPGEVKRRTSEIEQKLGTNWLNKIGITVLVIGIALFLAYKFPSLSNPMKVALGYAVSLAILGLGIYLELKDTYRIFARALIGGGWALTFFTTYAMHFVKYTQVIETQWVDLVLLFIVAGIMVVHTLRYNSQVVTGLAFLLAFTTVAISQNTVYCLAAGAILAIGLVAIVHQRNWFELEVFGLIASYLNHFIWLRTVIEPMDGHKHMFPELLPSAVLLCLYWAIYRWSYIARKITNENQERVSTFAGLLNTSFLLGLLKYQSVKPDMAFYVLLVLGATELTLAQLPVMRRRRTAFVILSMIGTTLLVAAIPFKFSGMEVAILWLAEAQMLFLAGVFTREPLFRRFGLLAALITCGKLLFTEAVPLLQTRLDGALQHDAEYRVALACLAAALVFYFNSHLIPRRWKGLVESSFEEACYRGLSYVAGLLLFVSAWLAFPDSWTAVALSAAALALSLAGRGLKSEELSYQAHGFAVLAFLSAVTVNREASQLFMNTHVTVRLVTLVLVIALFYMCARWAGIAGSNATRDISEMYATAAAMLAALLIYSECNWAWIGIGWGGYGLALAILGLSWKRRDFSYQAHLLALAGFARTLLVNIDATHQWHQMSVRLITFSIAAALLYLCAFFSGPRDSNLARIFSMAHTWAASILLAVLAYKEVSFLWIAVVWAAFALLLLIAGNRLNRIELQYQAHLLSLAALLHSIAMDMNRGEPFQLYPHVTNRLVSVTSTAVLLYLCAWLVSKGDFNSSRYFAAAYTWAGSLLIWLLVLQELSPLNVALGWVVFGLALFEIGCLSKSLHWRLQAYVVFAFAFARIFVINVDAPRADLLSSTLPLAAVFYYACWRAQSSSDDSLSVDAQMQAGPILSYLGSATVATVLNSWLMPSWVAAGWAGLALALIAVAWGLRYESFLHQSYILVGAVFTRVVTFNLVQDRLHTLDWMQSRTFHVGVAAALLFAGLAFAFPLRKRYAQARTASHDTGGLAAFFQRPEQFFFFIPLMLVTILIGNDVTAGRVTMAWGIESVAVFIFALMVQERSFRLTGLGLLLLCVGKILALDVWRQQKSDRFVTFIILGLALLVVSFLYTRYSEAIKRYL